VRFALLVNLNTYIKIVVIVNAEKNVDKPIFAHRLKGLRYLQAAEQALYRGLT
jgi:hypothetical protein